MDHFPTRFTISDLEGFSGVKAHTIRIWERRYNLLAPDRTDTNMRRYGLDELKTILNAAYLNRHGVKISRIAALTLAEREARVKEIAEKGGDHSDGLDALKVAMASYDAALFERTSEIHRTRNGFRSLIERLYIPLLEHIGVLWHSNSICPAQEHFVSNLVRQKIISAIDRSEPTTTGSGVTHVLFLPENEIHELGLLYIHYLLRTAGEQVIYLGQSVPMADLRHVADQFDGPLDLISIFTASPHPDDAPAYLERLRSTLPGERFTLRIAGVRPDMLKGMQWKGLRSFPRLADLLATLE